MSRAQPPVELRRVDFSAFSELSAGLNLLICHTPQWMNFLRTSQGAEPLLAEVLVDGDRAGIFTGALVRKAGLRILGSPLRGWTTSYMGFALQPGSPAPDDFEHALRQFAFWTLRCAHVEVLDRNWDAARIAAPWKHRPLQGYEIDLTQSEDPLFAAMSPACRRCIRKAEKSGVVVEVVDHPAGFAAEYYTQLEEVFAKDGVRPHYSHKRVEELIDALHPHGMLLLLRARDADGRSIATSIFPGCGSLMYFWGGASRQDALVNRPNEAMLWQAMRWWKARGVSRFDMGGAGDYKAKYGGTPITVPWLRCSRNPMIAAMRGTAERVLRAKQKLFTSRRN